MSFSHVRSDVFDRVSRSQYFRDNLSGLTAHERHQKLLAEVMGQQAGGGSGQTAALGAIATVTDHDVLRQHHRFLRGPEDGPHYQQSSASSWGARLARRYYDRLFKEYGIADLSRYRESKIGLRWRTQPEVVSGKGQFTCGAKGCSSSAGLAAFEVNFAYVEAGQAKQALVKLCLCEDCAGKLNYRRDKDKQYKKLQGGGPVHQQQERRQRQCQEQHGSTHRGHLEELRPKKHRGQREEQQNDDRERHWGRSSRHREEREAQREKQQQHKDRYGDDEPRQHSSWQRQLEEEAERQQQQQQPDHDPQQLHEQQQQQRLQQQTQPQEARGERTNWKRPHAAKAAAVDAAAAAVDVGGKAAAGGSSRPLGQHAGAETDSPAVKKPKRDDAAAPAQQLQGAAVLQDRWQLHDGEADEAAAQASAGGRGHGEDRWELEDGELNDTDIELWLDSLFSAAPEGGS